MAESADHFKRLYFAGIQRSATNYFQQLVEKNLAEYTPVNDKYARCLPLHKHFRLHDHKFLIPEPKYYNTFHYPDFNSFHEHVKELSGREANKYLVTVKNPYSWYLSYDRFARKNDFYRSRKDLNSHFVFDYLHYYEKWADFSQEAPDKVKIIRYEDLIHDLSSAMNEVAEFTGLPPVFPAYENVEKVSMSRRFNASRLKYYKNQTYRELLPERDKKVINQILGEAFFNRLGYDIER